MSPTAWPVPAGRKLVVDIGGGSTELIAGESFDAVRMESLYLGCVSMSRTYFGDGEITSHRWKRAEEKRVTLEFPAGWLRQHPLTGADLDKERAYLRSGGYTLHCS